MFFFVFVAPPSVPQVDSNSAPMDAAQRDLSPRIELTLRSKKRSAPPGEGGSALNHATNALSALASLVEQEKGVRPAVAALVVAPAMAGREGAGVAMTSRRERRDGARRRDVKAGAN